MQKTKLILAVAAVFGLAGCLESDLERGIAGAGAGAVASELFGTDPTASVVAGAAAGVFYDDVTGR